MLPSAGLDVLFSLKCCSNAAAETLMELLGAVWLLELGGGDDDDDDDEAGLAQ